MKKLPSSFIFQYQVMSKENCTPESLEKQLADYKKSTALFAAKYRNADFLAKRLL